MLYLSSKGEKVYMGMTLKKMDFKELTMWYDNARYEYELADEKECIITLFEITPGEKKMKNLLSEIIRIGEVRESLIIYKDNDKNIVLDGNRRISLLLIDKYPDLIEKYKISLQDTEMIKKISTLYCSVYEDLEEAYDHVESRHQGEQDGKGVVRWNSAGKQGMKEIRGQETSLGYNVIRFFKNSNLPQHAFVREHIKNISTIHRIVFKKCIYEDKFGLRSKDEYDLNNDQIINKLTELFEMFYKYDPNGNVNNVYYTEDIKRFFSDLEPISNNQKEQLKLDLGDNDEGVNSKGGTEKPDDKHTSDDVPNEGETKKKRNSYKSSIVHLFNWSSKGIKINNACLNYYIKSLNSYSVDSTSIMQNRFLYDSSPIYYRIILECAIKEFTMFITVVSNRDKFNAVQEKEYNCFNSTSKTTSLVTGNKLYGIYLIAKKIKDKNKKKEINDLIKALNKINMNSVEKYDSFVDGLNEVVHGFTKTLSDEKLLEYDTITLINLQLISIMTN